VLSISFSRNGNSEEITPDMVDDLARDMFPPCMRNIHSRLRKDHHLKYGARQQYIPFLKVIFKLLKPS
jgi:DNA primase large subunit